MSPEHFLASCWQKKPLHIPQALERVFPALSGDELAWLATLDDVESRLIYTEHQAGGTRYRVESGPFDADLLSNLPDRDWTLLVQDVEKHLPDFRQLMAQVPFIPDWRIDDLMISFAAPGGSVGPHKDNYDVFLCQGSGHHEWRVASAADVIEPAKSAQLALLQPFTDPQALTQSDGDVLYLPPGVPHWGIALDASMTYSIGMRAPTVAELRLSFEGEFPQADNPFGQGLAKDTVFYTDPDLQCDESGPGHISLAATRRCGQLILPSAQVSETVLATTLGCVVTDLKAWLAPEPPSRKEFEEFQRAAAEPLAVHGMARVAWWAGDGELLVFANGHCHTTSVANADFIRGLCAQREIHSKLLPDAKHAELFFWLLDIGVFDLDRNSA